MLRRSNLTATFIILLISVISISEFVLATELESSEKVTVIGAVHKPGAYQVKEPMNLQDILTLAGGATEAADLNQVTIISADGKDISKINLTKQNIKISPGYTIFVPQIQQKFDVTEKYIIGIEDVLNINVWNQPELSGEVIVRPDGMITLPLLGDIKVAGLSPSQLAAEIQKNLSKYVREANVTVAVTQFHSMELKKRRLQFDDAHEIPEPEKFAEMKLTEELNLSGETLGELVGANPRLSGLKEITARVYELLDFEWDSQKVESILEFYRDNLEAQGWQVMLRKIGENKATLNLVLQKDGGREGLFIVQLTPTELTLIKLMGKFSLGALDELRSSLRAEWQLDTLRPLPTREKPPIREPFSPSKIADYIPRSINVEHLEQAIEEGQTYPDIHTYLGIAYEHHSNFAKAQEQYQIVLDQFPDASDWILTRVLYGMGKCSEQLGEIEKAEQS